MIWPTAISHLFSQEIDLLIKVIMKCVNIKPRDILGCFHYILIAPRTLLHYCLTHSKEVIQLEDLTVLKRSPDHLNNVKIGQDQLQLIMKHIMFYGGCGK